MAGYKRKSIIILLAGIVLGTALIMGGLYILEYKTIQATDNGKSRIKSNIDIVRAEVVEKDVKENNEDDTDQENEEKDSERPMQIINNTFIPKDTKEAEESSTEGLFELKKQIEKMCQGNGQWAVYVKDLKSGRGFSINNKEMVAASVIKLFIMAKVYEAIDEGELKRNDKIDGLLNKMITISDNDASNELVKILGNGNHEEGMRKINSYARSINCLETTKNRRFYNSNPPANTKQNFTSVEDCGKLLERIYNHQCVSKEFDEEMIDLMKAQERNSKLPALLPKGVTIAHKTGEISTAEHDVGIVYGEKTDYIICVMSNELENPAQGRERVAEISKVVYGYFEGAESK